MARVRLNSETHKPSDTINAGNSNSHDTTDMLRVFRVSLIEAQSPFTLLEHNLWDTFTDFRKLQVIQLINWSKTPKFLHHLSGVWTRDTVNQSGVQHQWNRWWENLPCRSGSCSAEERERTPQECSRAEVRLIYGNIRRTCFNATCHILYEKDTWLNNAYLHYFMRK